MVLSLVRRGILKNCRKFQKQHYISNLFNIKCFNFPPTGSVSLCAFHPLEVAKVHSLTRIVKISPEYSSHGQRSVVKIHTNYLIFSSSSDIPSFYAKYWRKQIFSHGSFSEVGEKQKA